MHTIWSGSISFGLVNIPIRLYSATDEQAISFSMLHKDDLSPIRYARICLEDGKEIPYENIVKGYEYEKDKYVLVEDEDFKRASAQKTGTIEIVSFAKESEIDAIFFEKPYYLEPNKGADKPYVLLREALRQSNKVAIVKYVFKNKDHLGVIKPYMDALILDQLRFADEMRSIEGLKLPQKDDVGKKEIDMALKLIDQLTEKFDINDYHDTYTEKLQEILEDKIKGRVPSKPGKSPKPSKIHDIMSLLKASLEKPHQKKEKKKEKKKRTGSRG
jgi:DNA end-binding protein Ku